MSARELGLLRGAYLDSTETRGSGLLGLTLGLIITAGLLLGVGAVQVGLGIVEGPPIKFCGVAGYEAAVRGRLLAHRPLELGGEPHLVQRRLDGRERLEQPRPLEGRHLQQIVQRVERGDAEAVRPSQGAAMSASVVGEARLYAIRGNRAQSEGIRSNEKQSASSARPACRHGTRRREYSEGGRSKVLEGGTREDLDRTQGGAQKGTQEVGYSFSLRREVGRHSGSRFGSSDMPS